MVFQFSSRKRKEKFSLFCSGCSHFLGWKLLQCLYSFTVWAKKTQQNPFSKPPRIVDLRDLAQASLDKWKTINMCFIVLLEWNTQFLLNKIIHLQIFLRSLMTALIYLLQGINYTQIIIIDYSHCYEISQLKNLTKIFSELFQRSIE